MDDSLPEKPGEKFKYNGQVFTYIESRKEVKVEGGTTYTNDVYVLRSRTHELTYPPLRFLNDLYGGKIKRITES
jgi:hypothetical protein